VIEPGDDAGPSNVLHHIVSSEVRDRLAVQPPPIAEECGGSCSPANGHRGLQQSQPCRIATAVSKP
jgi:hypothetical protein